MAMPQQKDIDVWADGIYEEGMRLSYTVETVPLDPFKPYIYAFQSVTADYFAKITAEGHDTFYAYFQPCYERTAPLAVHTPGYGGEMSMHPELTDRFHVLHINPLGYSTPEGKNAEKLTMNGLGTVLPDTVLTKARGGYRTWLTECVIAIRWAFSLPSVLPRVSFFGTSQGGGASLLLGSVFSGKGCACVCADQPFMTNFPLAKGRGAYTMGDSLLAGVPQKQIDEALAYIDTLNHAHRYRFPVALTSGGRDEACPPDTVYSLFERLSGTRSYTHFEHLTHGYNREFVQLVRAFFSMYA